MEEESGVLHIGYQPVCSICLKIHFIEPSFLPFSVMYLYYYSLGTLNYQHSKYECEELELNELKNYIANLMKDIDSKNMSVARLE